MTDEITADELIDFELPDPNPVADPPEPIAPVLTDELRSQVLAEAITRGEVVPSSLADRVQPQAQPVQQHPQVNQDAPPDWNDNKYDGSTESREQYLQDLSDYKLRQQAASLRNEFQQAIGSLIPSIQSGAEASFVQGVPAEAAPYAQEIAKELGAGLLSMTPQQRQFAQDAALGAALREGKVGKVARPGYTPEPTTSGAGTRIAFNPGYSKADIEANEQLLGRKLTENEAREMGIIR